VRTDHRTQAALDTNVRIPDRDLLGNAAFLKPGRARRESTIGRQGADREQVALAGHHHRGDPPDEIGRIDRHDRQPVPVSGEDRGNLDLVQRRGGAIHRGKVPAQDRLPRLP